ncbi:MAG: nuclear transport factor 2 family protein [Bacteroidales bacterium]|nr:nuclear transport factor 2 family protein [Bacteroidales bacterium]MCF8343881.1 nuclear transport factor 2 family protein [Bacteroidales bacterium]MCF8350405.1 nuclear transport factor 2 family protein [Bacteroidales bacterium]MCF8377767.1 nuclear transport factor 2 family protein [Bacteroidales bacterium]
MKKQHLLFLISALLLSCKADRQKNEIRLWEKEILETEKAFAQMAQHKGIMEAFLYYAAEDAVLSRNNKLYKGRHAIRKYFDARRPAFENARLIWQPEFVEVSFAGDLGYTYGKYFYIKPDSTGVADTLTGIFHTVWKKQENGEWRFVWD